jgi:excisionase family DNA binding protein
MSDEPLLTIGEAARLLGISPITLRRWSDEGRVPVVVLPSGHRRFLASDIRIMREAS